MNLSAIAVQLERVYGFARTLKTPTPELIANGVFAGGSTTGWAGANSGVISASGNVLLFTNPSNYGATFYPFKTVPNLPYIMTFEFFRQGSAILYASLKNGATSGSSDIPGATLTISTGPGIYSIPFTALGADTTAFFMHNNAGNTGGTLATIHGIKNVSVRPVVTNFVNYILDTDVGDDIGDTAAMCDALALDALGFSSMLACVVTTGKTKDVNTAKATLNMVGKGGTPLGVYKGVDLPSTPDLISPSITDEFGFYGKTRADYPDALTVLRQTLAAQPNGSVTYIMIGTARSWMDLYGSPADSISPLTGAQLYAAKVKELIWAAGDFIDTGGGNFDSAGYPGTNGEFNIFTHPTSAQYLFANHPTNIPIKMTGYTMGTLAQSAVETSGLVATTNCVLRAYNLAGETDRQIWDDLGVLLGILGPTVAGLTLEGANGTMTVQNNGANRWNAGGAKANVNYYKLTGSTQAGSGAAAAIAAAAKCAATSTGLISLAQKVGKT